MSRLPSLSFSSLLLLVTSSALAFPFGGKSGFLGNTSSRPNDIGSVQIYPSTLSTIEGATKLYSGVMYYQASLNEGADEIKNKLVPFFTGTQYQIGTVKVATYFTYEDSFSGRSRVSSLDNSFHAEVSGTDENLILGIPAAIRLSPEVSLGFSPIVSIFTSQSNIVASQTVPSNNFLVAADTSQTLYLVAGIASVSYQKDDNFWSLGVRSSSLKVAGSGRENIHSYMEGTSPTSNTLDYDPKQRSPWVITAGWSRTQTQWKPAIDLSFYLPRRFIATDGALPSNSAEVSIASTFGVSAGLEVDLNSVSLFSGIHYKRKGFEASGYDDPMILSASLGVQMNSWESHPTIGMYYEQSKGSSDIELFGLTYTTRYDL